MGLTRKQKEVVQLLHGERLDAAVERVVLGHTPCECDKLAGLCPEGKCVHCGGTVAAQWCSSQTAAKYLCGLAKSWNGYLRDKFLDHLGSLISMRVGQGAVQPRMWILYASPSDICRAAVLAKMEETSGSVEV